MRSIMSFTVESIIIKNDKKTMERLRLRGFFSNDPQWLFNAMMVLESSKRDMIFNHKYRDLDKIEMFLVQEDIPYYRTLRGTL